MRGATHEGESTMFIETLTRSIVLAACALPAAGQFSGASLAPVEPVDDPCIVLAGIAGGTWFGAGAQEPGLLLGELHLRPRGAVFGLRAQLYGGYLAAPVGTVQQGALVGDLFALSDGPGAEPFARLFGVWSLAAPGAGAFVASIVDPSSPVFAPVQIGQVSGQFGYVPAAGPVVDEGSSSASSKSSVPAGGLVVDGPGVIVDPASPGFGVTATPGGAAASAGGLSGTAPSSAGSGSGASAGAAHGAGSLVGSGAGPPSGEFMATWSLCL